MQLKQACLFLAKVCTSQKYLPFLWSWDGPSSSHDCLVGCQHIRSPDSYLEMYLKKMKGKEISICRCCAFPQHSGQVASLPTCKGC